MEGKAGVREKIILGLLVLLLITGGIWRAVQVSDPGPEIDQAVSNEEQQPAEVEPEMISVHLVGAVENPGVYELPEGSRVFELLELGGGFSAEADKEALNQARPLFDGEQVYVHHIGEGPKISSGERSAKININQAGASELMDLPGIGEVRAGQIVDYRENHGLFNEKEEIMDVSGIGEATFNNIAEMITIY